MPKFGLTSREIQVFQDRFEALKSNADGLASTDRRDAFLSLRADISASPWESSFRTAPMLESIMDECEARAKGISETPKTRARK